MAVCFLFEYFRNLPHLVHGYPGKRGYLFDGDRAVFQHRNCYFVLSFCQSFLVFASRFSTPKQAR